MWVWIRDSEVKARKQHRCFLCGEKIEVNESYIARTGVEDVIVTFKMHIGCEKESSNWHIEDWETFSEGEMKRPASFLIH
jgi:hypothetical protein